MIGIKIDGQDNFLELAPETSISLKLENPILGSPDKLSPGSFSMPFDIPAGDSSPDNSAAIKNPDVVENNEAYSSQKAALFFHGVPFKRGNLKSADSGKQKASSYFTFGLNSISADFKTAKIRSVLDETIVINSAPRVKKVYVKKITAGDVLLVLNGTQYTFPNTTDGFNFSQPGFDAFAKTLDKPNEWWPVVRAGTGPTPGGMTGVFAEIKLQQYYTVSPGVYAFRDCNDPLVELHVAIGDGDGPLQYQVEADLGDYFSDFQTFMTSYVNSGSTYPNDKIRFPVVFNADMYGGDAVKEGECVNCFEFGSFIMNNPNWGADNGAPFQVKNYNSIQPFLLLKHVLDKIASTFGFTWSGDFYDHPQMSKILLWNTAPLDVPQKFLGDAKFVFWKRSFNLGDLIEDITVVEFLKRLQSRYNLAIFYSEITQTVQISFREPIAKSTVYEDITPISSPAKNLKPERFEGYSFRVEADTTDLFSVREEVVVGTPEEPIDVMIGRLFQDASVPIDNFIVSGPRVSQKMNQKAMLRVFHYGGIVNNTDYYYASAQISGPGFSESIIDLHADFHRLWLFFEKNRVSIKVETSYELRHLLKFDFALKRRYDRNNYLVKSIDVKLKNSGLEVSSLELITMR